MAEINCHALQVEETNNLFSPQNMLHRLGVRFRPISAPSSYFVINVVSASVADYNAFLGSAEKNAAPLNGALSAFTALHPGKACNTDLFKKVWETRTKSGCVSCALLL